jgi:hypothetical protein
MSRHTLIREDATIDLHEHFDYLAQNNRDSAFRFFDAARQTFAVLARKFTDGNHAEVGNCFLFSDLTKKTGDARIGSISFP